MKHLLPAVALLALVTVPMGGCGGDEPERECQAICRTAGGMEQPGEIAQVIGTCGESDFEDACPEGSTFDRCSCE